MTHASRRPILMFVIISRSFHRIVLKQKLIFEIIFAIVYNRRLLKLLKFVCLKKNWIVYFIIANIIYNYIVTEKQCYALEVFI